MKPKKKLTIKEIARIAGVSPGAVSVVLNAKKGTSIGVGKEKREKILQIVESTNYRPNILGKSLVSGKSYLIGILSNSITFSFVPQLLEAISESISEKKYGMLLMKTCNDPVGQMVAVELMLSKKVDGIITLFKPDPMVSKMIGDDAVKHVCLTYRPDKAKEYLKNTGSVYVNGYKIGYIAGKYLLEKGHRKIACYASPWIYSGLEDALAGFPDVILQKLSINMDSENSANEFFDRWKNYAIPPSAILINSDRYVLELMNLAFQKNINIPNDVSLMGVDGLPEGAKALVPLTTVSQPIHDQGKNAVELIFEMIAGKPSRKIVLDPFLLERSSVKAFSD